MFIWKHQNRRIIHGPSTISHALRPKYTFCSRNAVIEIIIPFLHYSDHLGMQLHIH